MSEGTPIRACVLSLEEVLGRMKFAVLEGGKREVSVVTGSCAAPDHPTRLCYIAVVIGHDGDAFTYEADASIGGTFMQDRLERGLCDLTADSAVVCRHLVPSGALPVHLGATPQADGWSAATAEVRS